MRESWCTLTQACTSKPLFGLHVFTELAYEKTLKFRRRTSVKRFSKNLLKLSGELCVRGVGVRGRVLACVCFVLCEIVG